MSVTIDLTAGEVRMAGMRLEDVVDASGVTPGAIRVGGVTVVKPLAYALRATLCARHRSPSALAPAVLAAATDGPSEGPALEALALHLAGADPDLALPGFSDVALVMGRVFGWAPDQLAETPAQWVDGLAASALDLEPEEGHDGWTTYRIDGVRGPDGESVVGLRDRLAADLIRRGAARLTVEAAPNDASLPHPGAVDHAVTIGDAGTPPHAADRRRPEAGSTDPGATQEEARWPSDEAQTTGREPVDGEISAAPTGARSRPGEPSMDRSRRPGEGMVHRPAATSDSPVPGQSSASPTVSSTPTGSTPVGPDGSMRGGVRLRPRSEHPSMVPSPATTVRQIERRARAVDREHPVSRPGRGDPGSPRSAHARPTAEARLGSATVDMADASLSDRVARALHDECDLRGILRW